MQKKVTQSRKKESGQVLLLVMLLVFAGCLVLVGGILALVRGQIRVVTELGLSKNSYILTEGILEEVVYRHMNSMSVANTETFTEGDATVTTTSTDIGDDINVLSVGDDHGRIRKIETLLIEGDGAAFSFGVQTGNGGFVLENSSMVSGNIYSNGSVVGANLNDILGTAISAGPTGHIEEIHTTGSAYANNIEDSYIEDDAFYTTVDAATIVDGTKYPGFPDLSTTSLPITDELLDEWETFAQNADIMSAECAAAGGHITYNTDVTLGPAKIPCDVTFTGNGTTKTFSGVVWVEGNLEFLLGPEYRVDPAIGNKSIPIIIDDPSDRLTSGKVDMKNSGEWISNGNRSYVLLISRNESAEQGGGEVGINITNSTGGKLLLYTNHGEIRIRNSVSLTEITAWRLRLQQSSNVIYDSGLASAIFYIGPGGGYVIDTWEEVN